MQEDTPLYKDLTSNQDGYLVYALQGADGTGGGAGTGGTDGSGGAQTGTGNLTDILNLPVGVYHLVETAAPGGYNAKTEPVVITVTSTNVTYDEGTTLSQSGSGRTYDASTRTYTLKISNNPGVELPSTGGHGTAIFYLPGGSLIAFACLMLLRKRRSRKIPF